MCVGGLSLGLRVLIGALAVLHLATVAVAQVVIVEPPVTVRLGMKSAGLDRTVLGDLVLYDDRGLTLEVAGRRHKFRWNQLTPHSAFTARYRLIDRRSARDWLELGQFARAIGAESEADKALAWARRLDPELTEETRRIQREAFPDGRASMREPQHERTGDSDGGAGDVRYSELVTDASPGTPLFEHVTPQRASAALAEADAAAERSLAAFGVTMRRLETPHFVIYTDSQSSDDGVLIASFEDAHRILAREFGVPPDDNVFVGKLPVYVFVNHDTFLRYAREIDRHTTFADAVEGYYTGHLDGTGKIVLSTPSSLAEGGGDVQAAGRKWKRNLAHELAHAFLAHYRGNGFLPRWLNEGLAEMIAEKVYPRPGALATARRIAHSRQSIAAIFDEHAPLGAETYPVMMTIVEALHKEDPAQFAGYIDRIKRGAHAEAVLIDMYGVDYDGLEAAWRQMMKRK